MVQFNVNFTGLGCALLAKGWELNKVAFLLSAFEGL
jgi:hypothetical protein